VRGPNEELWGERGKLSVSESEKKIIVWGKTKGRNKFKKKRGGYSRIGSREKEGQKSKK